MVLYFNIWFIKLFFIKKYEYINILYTNMNKFKKQ